MTCVSPAQTRRKPTDLPNDDDCMGPRLPKPLTSRARSPEGEWNNGTDEH
jgi:hypothetical protein